MTPRRTMILLTEILRHKVLIMLNAAENNLSKEICRNYMRLARKYYPDKWNENCEFTKEASKSVFKNLTNAYEILIEIC